jgi:predicted nucleotidyltransferase
MTTKRISLEGRIAELMTRLDNKFRIERALLFGSSARGDRLEESDIDIIVISSDFEGISMPNRQALIQREWNGEEEVQALAFTPEEFSKISRRSTMREILSYAKDISPRRAGNTCPKCGQKGSIQNKAIRNRLGKVYVYRYFAHYNRGKTRWCYLGKPGPNFRITKAK